MSDVYDYRTFRIVRAGWPALSRSVHAEVTAACTGAGGSVFALFAPVIGFATDEGVLMTAWPDTDALAAHAATAASRATGVIEAHAERLVPTVRPLDATPPREDGVCAHRWFWLQPQDWPEFAALSEDGIWPYFESDGCRVVGLWRSIEPGALAKALLITRYPSVAHWERTRLAATTPPPGADERLYLNARTAARRRAEITDRSIVRLTRLTGPS